jgi:long-subunit acyl-CoA synthetase (AMP-forming)
LSITGRKKDIIITAGGKNITPENLENDLKQSPFISQAVMYGDCRPSGAGCAARRRRQSRPQARTSLTDSAAA